MKFLEVDGVNVPYYVENRKIRNPRVEVTDRITVILPKSRFDGVKNISEDVIVAKFSKWMLKQYLELKDSLLKMPEQGIEIFGSNWEWFKGNKFSINSEKKTLHLDPKDKTQVKLFKKELKRKLLIKINGFCKEYATKYDFKYGTISIRNAKSRWGSCTPENNLNFSLRLFVLNDKLIRSVVYHELIHTIHKNHKKHFHSWLKREVPINLNKELHDGWIYAEVLFRKLSL
ncbi:MAG: M48 family metallopeptidase [Candidatus Altiarchaeota archaeon]|nr:M48 family metallopeptidase [Candidatus Altiarchaeota archaeon]